MRLTRRQLRRIILNEVILLNEEKNPADIRKILRQKGYKGITLMGSNDDADDGIIVLLQQMDQNPRKPEKAVKFLAKRGYDAQLLDAAGIKGLDVDAGSAGIKSIETDKRVFNPPDGVNKIKNAFATAFKSGSGSFYEGVIFVKMG